MQYIDDNKRYSVQTGNGNARVLSASGSAVSANVRQSASVDVGLVC